MTLMTQESADRLIPTSVAARRLGISLQATTRLVKILGLKPVSVNKQGGWSFSQKQFDAMARSDKYKTVIASRNHRKHARPAKVRVRFPYQPDALHRCVVCRNLCPGRKCAERGITISRLSVRTVFHHCQFFAGKEQNE